MVVAITKIDSGVKVPIRKAGETIILGALASFASLITGFDWILTLIILLPH